MTKTFCDKCGKEIIPFDNGYIEPDGAIIRNKYKVDSYVFCADCQRILDGLLDVFIEGNEDSDERFDDSMDDWQGEGRWKSVKA